MQNHVLNSSSNDLNRSEDLYHKSHESRDQFERDHVIDQINRFCQNNSKSICLVPTELKLIKNELALELIELLEPFCHGIALV